MRVHGCAVSRILKDVGLADAVGQIASDGFLKGASPVPRLRQIEMELEEYIDTHLLESMDLSARVHVLEQKPRNDASDTEAAVLRFLQAGCRTFISLGGDGTNRAIIRALLSAGEAAADVSLLPLSTGTNNVFPVMNEPTIAI